MRRPGPKEWRQLIEELRASGLQQKEFCAKHDLSLGTFQFWLYKKAKRSSGSESKSAPTFLLRARAFAHSSAGVVSSRRAVSCTTSRPAVSNRNSMPNGAHRTFSACTND